MQQKNIFLTGITGYVGGSVAVTLRKAGYHVTGLVRHAEDLEPLRSRGFDVIHGSLADTACLRAAIETADAVIHASECDDPAIANMLTSTLASTGKRLIYTSGSGILANWQHPQHATFVHTEDLPLTAEGPMGRRVLINQSILRSALRGVHSIVVVPSLVYGQGLLLKQESTQIPTLVRTALKRGAGVYVGSGEQRWSNVHVEDLADLYLLLLDKARPGTCFFAENGDAAFRDIAQAIHTRHGLAGQPVSLSVEEASAEWNPLMATVALGSDCRMNADKARLMLGWRPHRPALLNTL